MFEDYYCVLQVHPEAELEIIQSAYKRLCKKYHPDVNPTPQAMTRMQQINEAYETLSDEHKRRVYNAEWSRRTARPGAAPRPSPAPRVEVRERVVYVRPEPVRYGGGTREAYQVIHDYFEMLAGRRLREAYAMVSEADKKNFTYGSYVEWQDSVSALYEIGGVQLKLFKRHSQFKIEGQARAQAEEFAVTVTEKARKTGQVCEYTLNKYAVCEQSRPNDPYGGWRIYLGYRDLTPLTLQFRTVVNPTEAQMVGIWERYQESTDLSMGLPNRQGFEKRVEEEHYRYRRYHRPFSVAVLRVRLPKRGLDGGHGERVIRYVGYIIGREIRPTDHVAYFGDTLFGILFAETAGSNAIKAVRRLIGIVRHDIAACFDFDVDVRFGVQECDGRETASLIEGCLAHASDPKTSASPIQRHIFAGAV